MFPRAATKLAHNTEWGPFREKVADSCFEAREAYTCYVNIQLLPHTKACFLVTKTKLLMKPKEVSAIDFKNQKQHAYISVCIYTVCPRRNVPDFGRVFLMLKYTDITQNTYVQS